MRIFGDNRTYEVVFHHGVLGHRRFPDGGQRVNQIAGLADVVWATASAVPDLVAGGLIFLILADGARQIPALSR